MTERVDLIHDVAAAHHEVGHLRLLNCGVWCVAAILFVTWWRLDNYTENYRVPGVGKTYEVPYRWGEPDSRYANFPVYDEQAPVVKDDRYDFRPDSSLREVSH